MSNPYEGLQNFVDQLPEIVQPIVIAGLGMIPYVEGEGSAALGIIVGIHPVVAALAGATGNILSVIGVVMVSSRVRQRVGVRRSAKAAGSTITIEGTSGGPEVLQDGATKPTRRAKGANRLRGWMVRFGVPGASLLAPLALPTQLTAGFFIASGVRKGWVILWQVVAIVVWTGTVAAVALGVTRLLGW